jgi:hypothetical protein
MGLLQQASRRLLIASPLAEHVVSVLLGRVSTWPAREFSRFRQTPIPPAGGTPVLPPEAEPLKAPEPTSIAPGTFELRFTTLQREGRYHEMWDLLAEDAQRAWGGRDRFVRGMARQAQEVQVLEAAVGACEVVPECRIRERTYRNVARLQVRYRVRQDWRELTLDRQVHLIPAAGGWRTLAYPPVSATA